MEVPNADAMASVNNLILANCSDGMRFNGRMSNVRRFFCMFITFDVLFIDLFWLISVLVSGNSLKEVWDNEIAGYTFSSSCFDIAVCALVRFLLLLLCYGIIQINHVWFMVAATTVNCVFVGAKAMLFVWKKDNSYPFEVMIFLLSFIVAWAELWFIEVHVLPRERHATQLMQGVQIVPDLNRFNGPPIIGRIQEFYSQRSETATNFYSPLESPFASEADPDEGRETIEHTPQERQWITLGEESADLAYSVIQSGGWVEERHISDTDIIYSKSVGKDKKKKKTIYKLEAVIDCSPALMYHDCISNFENLPTWNKAVISCKHVQVVNSKTDITYNVAAEGGGGVVSSRDFVSVRSRKMCGDSYVVGGCATCHPDFPAFKKFVRGENGPNCVVFNPVAGDSKKCLFQFLLDVNLKGWIPSSIVSQALVTVLAELRDSIITHAATVR